MFWKKIVNFYANSKHVQISSHRKELKLTADEQRAFNEATHCHICERPLDRTTESPHRDHSHLTGLFRGI
jgi:hypothetical protein